MRAGNIDTAEARSLLGWWRLAGVDVAVSERPRDWLASPRAEAPTPASPAAPADAPPATLAAFQGWFARDAALGDGGRLAPEGSPAAGLMLLIDPPEPADIEAGTLLSGETGQLFDRMLAAIGRDRASIYLAPLAPTAGHRDAAQRRHLADIARQHAVLAAPKALLLMGDGPCQALLGLGAAQARGRLHEFNHGGTTIRAIATLRVRTLLERPQAKAHAWADLRLLMREMDR